MIYYTEIKKGDLLILVPKKATRETSFVTEEPLLWSHKKLDYRVFGKLYISLVVELYLRENPHIQKEAKIVDFTDPDNYSDKLEEVLLSTNAAKTMTIAYKYIDVMEKKYAHKYQCFFADTGWSNNTRDDIKIIPMVDYQKIENEKMGMLISSYMESTIDNYENVVCKMLDTSKTNHPFSISITNEKLDDVVPIPQLNKKISIQEKDVLFTIDNNNFYLSMSAFPYIVFPIGWRGLVAYTFDVFNVLDREYSNIELKLSRFSKNFTDRLYKKESRTAGNNIMSVDKSLSELINAHWSELKTKFPLLERVSITTNYEENPFAQYVHFHGENQSIGVVFTKKSLLETNIDYKITNKKQIVKSLFSGKITYVKP